MIVGSKVTFWGSVDGLPIRSEEGDSNRTAHSLLGRLADGP